jgi:hypothetical protein
MLETAEAARTLAISEGFKADIAGHQSIVETMHAMANTFARVEGKLGAILELTPVHGIRIQDERKISIETDQDQFSDEDDTPVYRGPRVKAGRTTPAQGSKVIPSPGLHGPKRPKTHG